jgi:3,4-dihydroxy 2-butanone 4-phosphate synthase/GTP cyclohydrolase II
MVSSIRGYGLALLALFRVLAPVRRAATASLPTEYGEFTIHVYKTLFPRGTHVALVCGEIDGGQDVLTRMHSTCLTGDIFHSVRCGCGAQVDTALRRISDEGRGVLLYLNQQGAGSVGVKILRDLGVRSMRLLGNDPRKLAKASGDVSISERLPIEIFCRRFGPSVPSDEERQARRSAFIDLDSGS